MLGLEAVRASRFCERFAIETRIPGYCPVTDSVSIEFSGTRHKSVKTSQWSRSGFAQETGSNLHRKGSVRWDLQTRTPGYGPPRKKRTLFNQQNLDSLDAAGLVNLPDNSGRSEEEGPYAAKTGRVKLGLAKVI